MFASFETGLYFTQTGQPVGATAISFLTSRVNNKKTPANVGDLIKCNRFMGWARGQLGSELVLWRSGTNNGERRHDLHVTASADASLHTRDGDGNQSGGVLYLGDGGAFRAQSRRQTLVANSSTGAEIISASEILPLSVWSRNFIAYQLGEEQLPATIEQDNMSAIKLEHVGRSRSDKTRWLHYRFFFIKSFIDQGEIKVVYTPTDQISADLMTKPVQGAAFKRHAKEFMLGKNRAHVFYITHHH